MFILLQYPTRSRRATAKQHPWPTKNSKLKHFCPFREATLPENNDPLRALRVTLRVLRVAYPSHCGATSTPSGES